MFNFQILIVLILSFTVLSFSTGSFPIAGVDEGRFAQSSANMLSDMNFFTPYFDGAIRLEKPILFYWEQILRAFYLLVRLNLQLDYQVFLLEQEWFT